MPRSIANLVGWRHWALDSVASTNEVALQKADEGDNGNLWVTAQQQSAGRARRGRSWVSERGNLYASALLVEPCQTEALVSLPLMVSLALHDALLSAVPEIKDRLKIKWPNDLLLDGKKISGILIESKHDAYKRLAIVVGCGVNCAHYPQEPLYPATSLKAEGIELTNEVLFEHLSHSFAKYYRLWAQGAGFAIIRREWLDRAIGVGEIITARFSDHEIKGRFLDIDEDGFLLLQDKRNIVQPVSAADIFFDA